MLLSARDQENRVLHGSTQNGKNQFPKTPGLGGGKKGLQDENEAGGFMTMGGKSTFKAHADAFMTPIGPRSRVPLGGKDTNVKAKQTIQFNDPLQQGNKPGKGPPSSTKQGSRLRRQTRLSVTPAKPITQDEDDVPEIEYMPPAPKELPDYPDDYVRIDMGHLKNTFFRDLNSTPIYNAKRKAQFERLTRYDEKAEEEEVERKLAVMFDDNPEKEITKDVKEKKKAAPRSYNTATKSSLAKRGPSRPNSALSTASRTTTTTTAKKPLGHSKKPSTSNLKMASKSTTSTQPAKSIGRKQGAVYHDQVTESLKKMNLDDESDDELQFALKESEKEYEDIERKMMELFNNIDEEEEDFQLTFED